MSYKQRSGNFSDVEKNILLDLVMQYKEILESQQGGTFASESKEAAWNEITKKFNRYPLVSARESRQLRICWKNLKFKARRDEALRRQKEECETDILEVSECDPLLEKVKLICSGVKLDSDGSAGIPLAVSRALERRGKFFFIFSGRDKRLEPKFVTRSLPRTRKRRGRSLGTNPAFAR